MVPDIAQSSRICGSRNAERWFGSRRQPWIGVALTNFTLYLIGVIVVVCALAYGAHMLGVGERWIGVGVAAGIGLGIMGAIVKTRRPQS
jgi:hypothetical protein